MLLKMCARCKAPVLYPAVYCPKCQEITDKIKEERTKTTNKKANRKYDKYSRNKQSDKFYHSPEWRALSAKVMQDNGYRCKDCGSIATQVHHEVEIDTPLGWDLRFDYDNLVCLCDKCHNKRHKRFGYQSTTS
ncbi:MAG: HNH endonuclease [Parabacteroides sp.]|nr:HNH endonuclease [Parabacteroides sp.]